MKSFKIPSKINMLGRTIKIEYDQVPLHEHSNWGETHYRDDKIVLVPNNAAGRKRTQQQLELTFLHEIVHWMLFLHDDKDLHTNERLVDSLAGTLREVLLQIKFE